MEKHSFHSELRNAADIQIQQAIERAQEKVRFCIEARNKATAVKDMVNTIIDQKIKQAQERSIAGVLYVAESKTK